VRGALPGLGGASAAVLAGRRAARVVPVVLRRPTRDNRRRMPAEKQLFILRHAKSSWDDQGLDDHDRPLALRGRQAVKLLREHMRAAGIRPVQVLCSSSRRTRETLEGVSPGGKAMIEPELYDASCEDLIERLRRVPEKTASVMVIGHNPAMQMLALELAGHYGPVQATGARSEPDSVLEDVRRKFPTGALATLTFDCAWGELAPGSAKLVELVRPRALR
jgi:phosphohistidine phosphatase